MPLSTLSITLLIKNFHLYSCVSHLKLQYIFTIKHICYTFFFCSEGHISRRMHNLKFFKHLKYLLLHKYWSFVCYLLPSYVLKDFYAVQVQTFLYFLHQYLFWHHTKNVSIESQPQEKYNWELSPFRLHSDRYHSAKCFQN